jgi:hypothetical protein
VFQIRAEIGAAIAGKPVGQQMRIGNPPSFRRSRGCASCHWPLDAGEKITGMGRIDIEAHDPARKCYVHSVGEPRIGQFLPVIAVVLAAVDADRPATGINGPAVGRIYGAGPATPKPITGFIPRGGVLPVRNSFDDLVGAGEDRLWDRKAERFRGLQIHDQLDRGGLIKRDVAWFGSAEHLAHLIHKLARQSP